MTLYGMNGTAHSTSFLTEEDVSDSIKTAAEKQLEFTKAQMKNKDYFGESILEDYASVAQNLAEEYESLDNDYVLEITKLLSTFTEKETSDSNFNACRAALDSLIKPDEIYLMETMFENDLESLSKDGIKIFEIDGGLDIRNKDERKQVSPEDRKTLEEHLVGSDKGVLDDYLDGGVDVSGQGITTSSISVGSKQGVQGSVGFDPDEVEMTVETKDGKKVLGYADDNH